MDPKPFVPCLELLCPPPSSAHVLGMPLHMTRLGRPPDPKCARRAAVRGTLRVVKSFSQHLNHCIQARRPKAGSHCGGQPPYAAAAPRALKRAFTISSASAPLLIPRSFWPCIITLVAEQAS
eukprot:351805-Chlamydomonas_euryale.AAC.3